MSGSADYTLSGRNVFADLDVAEPAEALVKAQLARVIGDVIARRRLTQTQAAELLRVDQPKVSALRRGQLAGFSTDRLLRFLNALDRDVEIVVKTKPRSRKRAEIVVTTR
jgi:predicted XRE-type DNA-binding protein